MKWQSGKIILGDAPARVDSTVHSSSATSSPKTNNILQNKPDQKAYHLHKWSVSNSVWRCSICGKRYG